MFMHEADLPRSWFAGYTDDAIFRWVLGIGLNEPIADDLLVTYLRSHLSAETDIATWMDDCRAARMPPLSAEEVAQRLGVSVSEAYAFLFQHRVPYVRLSALHDSRPRFSPLWSTNAMNRKPCWLGEIARLFDVDVTAPRRWHRSGRLYCSLGHRHPPKNYMHAICWLAYLTTNADYTVAPQLNAFWQRRLVGCDASPLLGLMEAGELLGTSSAVVRQMAHAGEILGILTPLGSWKFAPEWLR